MEKIAFCVITFDQIKIQTHSAPQNDRPNFSFVKDIHVVAEKLAIDQSQFFGITLYFRKFLQKVNFG